MKPLLPLLLLLVPGKTFLNRTGWRRGRQAQQFSPHLFEERLKVTLLFCIRQQLDLL
jgi:hypothetical protein